MRIILGIDPGLNNTGWGLINNNNNKTEVINFGVISNPKTTKTPVKLFNIFTKIDELIQLYKPNELSLEKTFINSNLLSSLNLGYSRAVILLLSEKHKIPIFEYSPNTIKQNITGNGHATKEQISYMIEKLLNITTPKTSDITDALAIALCHANYNFKI